MKIKLWFYNLFSIAVLFAVLFALIGPEKPKRILSAPFSQDFLCDLVLRWRSGPPYEISQHIVLVNLCPSSAQGQVDRNLLADVIDRCNKAGAVAIGVDVFLWCPDPGDEKLSAVFARASNKIVLVSSYRYPMNLAPSLNTQNIKFGIGNFPTTGDDQTIRYVQLYWDNDPQKESFSYALFKKVKDNQKKLKQFPLDGLVRLKYNRINQEYCFTVMQAKKIIFDDEINYKNKIVIIGDVECNLTRGDSFVTPVGQLKGIIVHATALETLLNNNSPITLWELLYNKYGLSIQFGTFLILSILFLFLLYILVFILPDRFGSGIARIAVLFIVGVFLISIGVLLFIKLNIIFPSPLLLYLAAIIAKLSIRKKRK